MSLITSKDVVHVEVCLKRTESTADKLESLLQAPLRDYLSKHEVPINKLVRIDEEITKHCSLLGNVESLMVQSETGLQFVTEDDLKNLMFHCYCPHRRAMELEMFEIEEDGDSAAVPSSNHWILPSTTFIGLWENLIYEQGLKEKLLKFALSALTFSQHSVDHNVITCNRLILLHGPPGTGKTSLCKALTQKLAIRTCRAYRHTHLIEINSHSLFSKWFSESGKLVMRLFAKIHEIIVDPHNLVCVLIDEVESIAYARNCMSGQEPKDAMRVVNALLTQLDSIKEHPNVLILATSNLADTIDLAFLDRADIKQYIALPSMKAIKHIYESMLLEMMRVGIIEKESFQMQDKHENLLSELAERSEGLSGRAIRKLPFLAHAIYTNNSQFGQEGKIALSDFLDALLSALEKHKIDHSQIKK